MKQQVISLVLAAISLTTATLASAEPNGRAVPVSARDIFVPTGFDDNDAVIAVVDGYLPSTCYRIIRPMSKLDPVTQIITITPMARYFAIDCLAVPVPYSFTVTLGQLKRGSYQVRIATDSGMTAVPLQIRSAATNGPDDFLYAPVDGVDVMTLADGTLQATITGRFTSSCMSIEEVKTIDTSSVIDLLPIMRFDDDGTCQAGEYPFIRHIALPLGITTGRHLLHVRSLNGSAITAIFQK